MLNADMGHDAGFASARHAVLIGLDGLSVRALHRAINAGLAPNLKALRERGAYTDDARCTMPSISLPNWASTLFSAPPEFHGVHTAALDDDVRPATFDRGAVWPNMFTAARAQRPGLSTGAFYSWPPLAQLLPPRSLNASTLHACKGCDECLVVEARLVSSFANGLRRSRYALSWLYIDMLDECGHARGGDSAGYLQLVQTADAWVGRVLEALQVAGMSDKTTLIVMSDHGREVATGREHGGFTTEELAVQWLLVGPSVRPGHRITWPVSIMDSAPTLLHALGLGAPVEFTGRAVKEAFIGSDVPRVGGQRAAAGWHAPNASTSELMPISARRRGGGSSVHRAHSWLSGWDLSSLAVGGLLGVGVAVGAASAAMAMGWWPPRGRIPARPASQFFNLAGAHPAADRLRAAAGEPDYEYQGLLRCSP